MTRSAAILEASYAACRRIGRRARSNLYFGFPWFAGEKRRAMDALYAFARLTDDLADAPTPVAQRRCRLAAWRNALECSLANGNLNTLVTPSEDGDEIKTPDPLITLPAVADMVERFSVPREHLFTLIDGAEMDLDCSRYETIEQLEGYCRCVASSIGLASVHIWGFRDAEVFAPAERCGIALQWTNILRDVKEDLARDRVYLPRTDLRRHQVTEADLRGGVADTRFHHLMAELVERGQGYYREGLPVLQWLEPAGRRVCGMMIDRYRALLDTIGRDPEVVLQRRVTLPCMVKARLALRWLLRGRTAMPHACVTTAPRDNGIV